MTNFVCIRQPSALYITYFKGVCHLNLALISLMALLLARVIRCSVVVGDERTRIKKKNDKKKQQQQQQPQIGGVHTAFTYRKRILFGQCVLLPFLFRRPPPPPQKKQKQNKTKKTPDRRLSLMNSCSFHN